MRLVITGILAIVIAILMTALRQEKKKNDVPVRYIYIDRDRKDMFLLLEEFPVFLFSEERYNVRIPFRLPVNE